MANIDWAIEIFDTLPSTMDVAHQAAINGAKAGYVVVAREQNAGRGRRGNSWDGLSGNLYFSALLQPDIQLKDIGQYSFIASVALGRTVKPFLNGNTIYQNKWPNDGLVDDKKFAGILIETGLKPDGKLDYLNIGIGINIADSPESKTYLNRYSPEPILAEELLKIYLRNLNSVIELSNSQGFKEIRRLWLAEAKGLQEELSVKLPDETLHGIFNGLDENGALLLGLDNGGQKVIHSGEVFFRKDI